VTHTSSSTNHQLSIRLPMSAIPAKPSGRLNKSPHLFVPSPVDDPSRAAARPRKDSPRWHEFEAAFLASRSKFVRIAYGILRNREDAEDAVQDALISAYVHLPSFEGRSVLKTWFTRIVLNASLMILRKRKPTYIDWDLESTNADGEDWLDKIPSSKPDPESAYAAKEKSELIDSFIAELSPTLRKAFTMAYFQEIDSRQAGALLGITAENFKSRVWRAKRYVTHRARRSIVAPIRSFSSSPYIRAVAGALR
jgi:RNA polymerase sigma-70 factor, ECF subfamily